MDELIEPLKDFRARVKEGHRWSDDDIVEALRQMSYDVLDAAKYLIVPEDPYPFASTKGQWKLLFDLIRSDLDQSADLDPPNMVELVHQLLGLELKHNDELLCSEVVVCALRNAYFDLDRAANDLLTLVGEYDPLEWTSPTRDETAIKVLRSLFRELGWKPIVKAYADANHDWERTLTVLTELASGSDP
jgi:hypothetical protein